MDEGLRVQHWRVDEIEIWMEESGFGSNEREWVEMGWRFKCILGEMKRDESAGWNGSEEDDVLSIVIAKITLFRYKAVGKGFDGHEK